MEMSARNKFIETSKTKIATIRNSLSGKPSKAKTDKDNKKKQDSRKTHLRKESSEEDDIERKGLISGDDVLSDDSSKKKGGGAAWDSHKAETQILMERQDEIFDDLAEGVKRVRIHADNINIEIKDQGR